MALDVKYRCTSETQAELSSDLLIFHVKNRSYTP